MTLISQEHLNELSKRLKEILHSEISLGNEIVETSKGWPYPETVIVFLRRSFKTEYTIVGLDYTEINDPHWWKSEYHDRDTKHILACKFD
jgi:hypothetical protein